MPTLLTSASLMGVPPQYSTTGDVTTATFDFATTPTTQPTVDVVYVADTSATTVSLMSSRSSADGIAWSSWAAPSGATLTSPLARYVQLVVRLATTDTLRTPNLRALVLHATAGDAVISANWDWNGGAKWNA